MIGRAYLIPQLRSSGYPEKPFFCAPTVMSFFSVLLKYFNILSGNYAGILTACPAKAQIFGDVQVSADWGDRTRFRANALPRRR
jgi:hypothetical protein